MAVQYLKIEDTRAWFLAGDHDVMVGDVLDLATTSAMRVRFGRYAKGAQHEWVVTHVHRAGWDREPAADPAVRSISGVPRLVPAKPAARLSS